MTENVNDNFIDVEMGSAGWDWFVVIDNMFTYLFPEDASYPEQLLRKAYTCLNSGGQLIIDFINYAKRLPDVEYKSWSAFSVNDPYTYGLYSNKITNEINCFQSIFIKRDGSESQKIELMKVIRLNKRQYCSQNMDLR